MSKHLADHRSTPTSARVMHFLRLARNRGEATWQRVWQKAKPLGTGNRRILEYVRIERGRDA